jgi:hypothetical protein
MAFALNDIYLYIFSWKHVTTNAIELYRKISPHFPQTFFINCDEQHTITDIPAKRVIQKDDSYYYGGQFLTASQHLPPGKILACVVGDVQPHADWAQIATYALDAFNTETVGIYAPNVHVTAWPGRGAPINIEKGLYSVRNTDCTCWFIHPMLTNSLSNLDYYALSNLGWGIDLIFCDEALRNHLRVARDYRILVKQPAGTSYNTTIATTQMDHIRRVYKELVEKRALK